MSPPLCCTAGYLRLTLFVVLLATSVSPSLLYCWLPVSPPCCCTASYQCLPLFVVLLATSVSPSLLYCWLPVSPPCCCTASYQCLPLFVVLLATSFFPSLLYCWLSVSPPRCCTAGYQCHVSSTSQALEVTKDTNSGMFVEPLATSVSPSLLYCWLPASSPLCCTAGCQCLPLIVVLLATSAMSLPPVKLWR